MHVASQTALYVGNPGPVLCICLLVVDSVGRGIGSFVPGYRYLIVHICLYRNQLHFARHNGNCHAFSIFIVCTPFAACLIVSPYRVYIFLSACQRIPAIRSMGIACFPGTHICYCFPGPGTRLLIVNPVLRSIRSFFPINGYLDVSSHFHTGNIHFAGCFHSCCLYRHRRNSHQQHCQKRQKQ